MFENRSPWLHQLKRTRPIASVAGDFRTDVAIIGAGIAGISTAYFTLKNTSRLVTIIEADKVAHGATGHNGGFLASYFERTFSSLVEEFGLEMAAQGQQAVDSAWQLLEQIHSEAKLTTPIWQFTGYAACATYEELLVHLENNVLRAKAGLTSGPILVSDELPQLTQIPENYKNLYQVVPKKQLLSLIETEDTDYIAVLAERKGCMNSAHFCEELINYLLSAYPDRLTLAEHTPVRRLVLKNDYAILDVSRQQKIVAQQVVLCTNGFEKINIINTVGPAIDKKFHHLVRGIVGYMAGYIEDLQKPAAEISYLPKKSDHVKDIYKEEPYFYLTRRPFETEDKKEHSLISVGGPEALMDDTNNYHQTHPYSAEAKTKIDTFLRETYKHGPKDAVEYKFLWHGLMGFTPNGVRLVGPEPYNPILLYNLGCNGVGLLPSIYGGQKISWHLAGRRVDPSIFDAQGKSPKPTKKLRQ